MRRPPVTTWLLGHPLIVMATAGAALWSITAWVQGGNGWLALLAIIVLSTTAKESQRRSSYLAFRREWDRLASPASAPAQRTKTFLVVLLAVPLLGGGAYYLFLTIDQPGHALALVGMASAAIVTVVGAGIIAAVRAIMRARARRRANHAARIVPVEVCVTRPLLPVPSLTDAYRALPAYCWRILSDD